LKFFDQDSEFTSLGVAKVVDIAWESALRVRQNNGARVRQRNDFRDLFVFFSSVQHVFHISRIENVQLAGISENADHAR